MMIVWDVSLQRQYIFAPHPTAQWEYKAYHYQHTEYKDNRAGHHLLQAYAAPNTAQYHAAHEPQNRPPAARGNHLCGRLPFASNVVAFFFVVKYPVQLEQQV